MPRNNKLVTNSHQRTSGPDYQRPTPYGLPPRAPLAMRMAVVPHERSSSHDRALEALASRIGYRLTTFNSRDRRLVFADALTVLEKLRFSCQATKRPRELAEEEVMMFMQELIPMKYITNTGIDKATLEKEGTRVLPNLMIAACEYIGDLQKEEVESTHQKADDAQAQMMQENQQEPLSIEKTLEQIEKWCEAWEAGVLGSEEWENFETCLRRDDI